MNAETHPVVAISREWAIQIFASSDPHDVEPTRAALESGLADQPLHVQESTDGVRHFLVAETLNDSAVMELARSIVCSVGSMALEHVHLPPEEPALFARRPRPAVADGDRAA